MSKKKIEHYVPQCYLEKWCMPNSKHVNVFDKEQDKSRTNHIEDVASEKYFYDIDLSGVLTKEEIKFYDLDGVDLSRIDDEQYIENFFSENVESAFKSALDDIVLRARKMTPRKIKHCTFISKKRIHLFSLLMAFQYVRVKDVRNSLEELVDMLNQALSEHSASQEMIDKYGSISKKELKYVHGKIICNIGEISKIANTFSKHIWLLFKNTTNTPFFTSDNPIGTTGHIKHPYISMSGLSSQGVEVYFPIAPDLMLILLEKTHHKIFKSKNRHIIEIDEIDIVNDYNSRCVMNSSRCVFSKTDDFSIIDKMKEKQPDVLQLPKSTLTWEGKTYVPSKNYK